MSNLIKSRYVYVNGNDKKIIDSNGKIEEIHTIHIAQPFHELFQEQTTSDETANEDDSFTEGIKATVIKQEMSEQEMQLLQNKGDQILSDAREQAAQILEQAKNDAILTSQKLKEEARKKGYEEGLNKAMTEVNLAKKELEELIQKQNSEYFMQIESLEPQFANVLIMLMEKMTGIVVEDKKDVILYLIHNAMVKADNSKSYTIRTSKDDYDFVISKKDELDCLVKGDASIDIAFDASLSKNQCIIETDTRIIDCSLDVQLKNLVQDIKLLSLQKE